MEGKRLIGLRCVFGTLSISRLAFHKIVSLNPAIAARFQADPGLKDFFAKDDNRLYIRPT
jgi:hypothetical protein